MISRQLARLGVAMESGSRPSLGQVILLGTSSMVTAVLYSIYRQKAQVAQELKVSAESARTRWLLAPGRTGEPLGRQRGPQPPAASRLPRPFAPVSSELPSVSLDVTAVL